MRLFSKKKDEPKPELPPLKFPEFPKEKQAIPPMEHRIPPSEATMIKKAVTPPPKWDIPIRKPVAPKFEAPEPVEPKPRYGGPREVQTKGQTLFVKIERYREAVERIEQIKEKITEAEKVLRGLDEMKRREDEELIVWHQDLEAIKGKILAVDRELFEGSE